MKTVRVGIRGRVEEGGEVGVTLTRIFMALRGRWLKYSEGTAGVAKHGGAR